MSTTDTERTWDDAEEDDSYPTPGDIIDEEKAENERLRAEVNRLNTLVAATDSEAQVRALREAAEVYGPGQLTFMGSAQEYTRAWLNARADRIERGERS